MFQRVLMAALAACVFAGCAAEQPADKIVAGSGQQAKVNCSVDGDAPSTGSRIPRKSCS